MSSKKKELEIVYNLEWKNKPANGDEKSNMVGILDIPATTLDWKTFKSYLLKNSGAADDNVKVSYIDTEDREKAINSQLDFEIALYTFRHKARMNEIITLKLDCVNGKKSGVKMIAKELSDMPKRLNPIVKKSENPPEWFTTYMKKFKEELVAEISMICVSKTHQMNVHHARKLKADRQRTRKTPLLFADSINDKELSKSAKMERKLESKLEKLEHKTMKIKAKKMALRGSSDSDVGRSSGKNDTFTYLPPTTNDMSMNASLIKKEPTPHMTGGESYCKTWEVSNSGTLPWTSSTGLRYAWGSQALKPLSKEVQCPPLQPGQSGKICVLLEIPKIPGTYECYWHFYHEGRRFGHWLGCEVIVDGPPVKNVPFLPSPTYDVINIQDMYELVLPTVQCWSVPKSEAAEAKLDDFENPFENVFENDPPNPEQQPPAKNQLLDAKEENASGKIETNPFSDSDNQSIISISDSSVNSATSEDFVLLRASPKDASVSPVKDVCAAETTETVGNLLSKMSLDNAAECDCVDVAEELKVDCAASEAKEEPVKVDELVQTQLKPDLSSSAGGIVQQIPIDLSNKSTVSEADKEKDDIGYAYVHYKGRKIPIPKKHLSPEFLVTAESVPESELRTFNKSKVLDNIETEPVKEADAQVFRTSTPFCDVNPVPPYQTGPKPADSRNLHLSGHPFCSVSMNNSDCASNCGMGTSMNSSANENRFFVFPQSYPGYEVVPPYVEQNSGGAMPFQSMYGYNTVGEVLVNDWMTGLNYAACVRYPNPPSNQYYNQNGNSTSSTSRGCSSIPNSSIGSPLIHSPQSPPREHCACQGESAKIAEQNANMNCSFEMPRRDDTSGNSEHNRAPPPPDSARTNSRVPDILSGATVVATSAINTARSVLNMFVPPRAPDCGRWQNGHWISTNPESKREKNLQLLHDMGFVDRDLNATLLARYNDEIYAVLSDLLQ